MMKLKHFSFLKKRGEKLVPSSTHGIRKPLTTTLGIKSLFASFSSEKEDAFLRVSE
jgi:hypothetical protein